MKKVTLFVLVVFAITISASTNRPANLNNVKALTAVLADSKYKACIEACSACILTTRSCEYMCAKEKDPKMAQCLQYCKEAVSAMTASRELMDLNSQSVKEMVTLCASICEKCALECEKFTTVRCSKCAADCRIVAKECRAL